MTLEIEGVPASVTRQQVVDLLATLGIDANRIPRWSGVHIGIDAIRCTVLALDSDGRPFADDEGNVATHELMIPVEDRP